jgi:hypothetical protein
MYVCMYREVALDHTSIHMMCGLYSVLSYAK